jgi:hypothetical protein
LPAQLGNHLDRGANLPNPVETPFGLLRFWSPQDGVILYSYDPPLPPILRPVDVPVPAPAPAPAPRPRSWSDTVRTTFTLMEFAGILVVEEAISEAERIANRVLGGLPPPPSPVPVYNPQPIGKVQSR